VSHRMNWRLAWLTVQYCSDYKNKALKQDELRRRREEQQVEIRRQKREENIAKRRNFISTDGPDSDDDSATGNWDSPVCT
jgi:importin subunit alpha-6/7